MAAFTSFDTSNAIQIDSFLHQSPHAECENGKISLPSPSKIHRLALTNDSTPVQMTIESPPTLLSEACKKSESLKNNLLPQTADDEENRDENERNIRWSIFDSQHVEDDEHVVSNDKSLVYRPHDQDAFDVDDLYPGYAPSIKTTKEFVRSGFDSKIQHSMEEESFYDDIDYEPNHSPISSEFLNALANTPDFNEFPDNDDLALFRAIGSHEIVFEERPMKSKWIGPYLIGELLGEGSYGKVKEVIDSRNLRRLAVKIFSQRKLRRIPNSKQQVLTELQILRAMPAHENVCQMFDLFEKKEKHKLYLIIDLGVGVLSSILQNMPANRLPPWKAHYYFSQLINAVEFIHSLGVIHKDIKPENLVIDGNDVLKLIDFGVAERLDMFAEFDFIYSSHGSPAVQSPEVTNGKETFHGFKLDIWACGITLFNMVTGEFPFTGETVFELFDNIGNVHHQYPKYLLNEPDLCYILDRMLEKDEDKRYSLRKIKATSWFRRNHPQPHDCENDEIADRIKKLLVRPMSTMLPFIDTFYSQNKSPDTLSSNETDRIEGAKLLSKPSRDIRAPVVMFGIDDEESLRGIRDALPSPEILRAVRSSEGSDSQGATRIDDKRLDSLYSIREDGENNLADSSRENSFLNVDRDNDDNNAYENGDDDLDERHIVFLSDQRPGKDSEELTGSLMNSQFGDENEELSSNVGQKLRKVFNVQKFFTSRSNCNSSEVFKKKSSHGETSIHNRDSLNDDGEHSTNDTGSYSADECVIDAGHNATGSTQLMSGKKKKKKHSSTSCGVCSIS